MPTTAQHAEADPRGDRPPAPPRRRRPSHSPPNRRGPCSAPAAEHPHGGSGANLPDLVTNCRSAQLHDHWIHREVGDTPSVATAPGEAWGVGRLCESVTIPWEAPMAAGPKIGRRLEAEPPQRRAHSREGRSRRLPGSASRSRADLIRSGASASGLQSHSTCV